MGTYATCLFVSYITNVVDFIFATLKLLFPVSDLGDPDLVDLAVSVCRSLDHESWTALLRVVLGEPSIDGSGLFAGGLWCERRGPNIYHCISLRLSIAIPRPPFYFSLLVNPALMAPVLLLVVSWVSVEGRMSTTVFQSFFRSHFRDRPSTFHPW